MKEPKYITEFQNKQHKMWIEDFNDPQSKKFSQEILPIDLLKNSKPIESNIFQLDSVNNIQHPYTYISIKTKFGTSYFYIPTFYTGWNEFITFLESLCFKKDTYIHYGEGEGADSIFYMNSLSENKIRFVHFSENLKGFKYNNSLDKYEFFQAFQSSQKSFYDEPYQIRQDVIIDKYIFIKSFYKELLLFFQGYDEVFKEYRDDYEQMTKSSEIIRTYLNKYNIRYKEYF